MNFKTTFSFIAVSFAACAACAAPDAVPGDAAVPAAEAKAVADSDYKARATELMNAGLDWLKANQSESGAWSDENYPGLSALGLWAMARSGREDLADARAKAAKYIARYVQTDGSIYKPATGGRGSGGLSTYNTAICMMALHAHDKVGFQKEILKAREFVASSQLEGDSPAQGAGGFGYDKPAVGGRPQRADLSNTGLALMAMRTTQDVEDLRPAGSKNADVDWNAALAFVESMQIKAPGDPAADGAFGYEQTGERGGRQQGERKAPQAGAQDGAKAEAAQSEAPAKADGAKNETAKPQRESLRTFGSMTYAGLESMIYAQVDLADPRVRSTIAWAGRNWTVAENPGQGVRGLYYYYVILSKALVLAGDEGLVDEAGAKIDWRGDLVDQLAKSKDAEGFWSNEDNTFWEGDPALVTAYVVLSLESVLGL